MIEQLDDVTIRTAEVADAAKIAGVHVRSWQQAYSGIVPPEHLAALDVEARTSRWQASLQAGPADRVLTWVAESDGEIIGFASLGPGRDEDAERGDQEIYSIYLDAGVWGHGVARDLMRALLAEAGDATRISLWVLADNERARHFYRRHGFAADGVERYEQIGGAELLEVRYLRG